GIAEAIALDAAVTPFAADRKFTATLSIGGIKPDALAPYLRAAGIGCELEHGALRLAVAGHARSDADGRLAADVELKDVAYTDGKPLFATHQLAVRGFAFDPKARTLAI